MIRANVETTSVDPLFLAPAAAAAVLTLGAMGLVAARTRPRRPTPEAPTMDLGSETPAVVDLLTDDFEVTAEAVPATLLDLAARRWISIEETVPGSVLLRLPRREGKGPLTAYEERVLAHVRGLSEDGVVPAEALTTGPEAASRRWWRGFRGEVIGEARERGLCRPRWDARSLGAVWLGVVVSAALLFLSMRDEAEAAEGADAGLLGLWFAVALGVAGLAWLAWRYTRSMQQRDTDEGLRAAGAWLGVRRFLAETGDFSDKSAAAVILWERYLAYAAAMDLAPVAVRQLPLGAEDDHHAWSRATGEWRRVRVRYPRLRPGWGRHPLGAAAAGGLVAAVAAFGARLAAGAASSAEGAFEGTAPDFGLWAGRVALVVAAALAVLAAWHAVEFALGLADAFAGREVEGLVLRRRVRRAADIVPGAWRETWHQLRGSPAAERFRARRSYFIAVDAGGADEIAAWRVRPAVYNRAEQGAVVLAVVTPRLGYVRSLEVRRPPAPSEPAAVSEAAAEVARAAAGPAGGLLGRIGGLFDSLAGVRDERGEPVLDHADEKGVSLRRRLQEALERMSEGTAAAPAEGSGERGPSP